MSRTNNLEEVVGVAKRTFATGLTKNVEFRRQQLKALYKLLSENESQFVDSLRSDLKKPRFESIMTEVDFVLNDIRSALNNLDSWTKPKWVSKCFVTLVDDNYIHYEPYGVVLVLGAWNYPVQLSISPLVGAIAAGNVCIIKPSEIAPSTARLLLKLFPVYLHPQAYQCVLGDGSCAQVLVSSPDIDYVFFTGSSHIGKKIYQSASQNLTPCTLEMGGKSPVYLDQESYYDSKSDQFNERLMETAVRRILWGKFINTGQTCVAPDYVLCSKLMIPKFIEVARKIIKQFYGDCPESHKDYGRIVSSHHYERLKGVLKSQFERQKSEFGGSQEYSNNGVVGGEFKIDSVGNYYIEPTIIACSSFDAEPIMQSEIFGPILPLVPVVNADEAIRKINSREKPLSLYIFSTRDALIKQFQMQTSSGSICVNDTVLHLVAEALPFGGVGKSGIGAYHGKHSFKTFSHQKSMLVRGFNPIIEWVAQKRYPPYSENHLKRMLRLLKRRKNPVPISSRAFSCLLSFMLGILICYMDLQIMNQAYMERD